MFLGRGLDDLAEVQKLVALLRVEEVGQALAPRVLIVDQYLHQLLVVLQLRVDDLDVLLVLPEEVSEVLEGLLNALGQPADGLALRGADAPEDALGGEEHLGAQVVAAHALGVRDGVDLAQHLDHLASLLGVLLGVQHDAAAGFLAGLDLRQVLFELDRVGYEATSVCLDQHQLQHVDLLIGHPGLVELLEVLGHVVYYLLHSDVNVVLNDPLVDAPDNALNDAELLEQLASSV